MRDKTSKNAAEKKQNKFTIDKIKNNPVWSLFVVFIPILVIIVIIGNVKHLNIELFFTLILAWFFTLSILLIVIKKKWIWSISKKGIFFFLITLIILAIFATQEMGDIEILAVAFGYEIIFENLFYEPQSVEMKNRITEQFRKYSDNNFPLHFDEEFYDLYMNYSSRFLRFYIFSIFVIPPCIYPFLSPLFMNADEKCCVESLDIEKSISCMLLMGLVAVIAVLFIEITPAGKIIHKQCKKRKHDIIGLIPESKQRELNDNYLIFIDVDELKKKRKI